MYPWSWRASDLTQTGYRLAVYPSKYACESPRKQYYIEFTDVSIIIYLLFNHY